MKKDSAINTFQNGLVMDFNPLATPGDSLSNCLNGTILTYNGNEHVLQNDMGNGRVHSAQLPEGYIPIGTCSFGGIIYIVSYNPLSKLCQIGSFPSPQRNFTQNKEQQISVNLDEFIEGNNIITNKITTILSDIKLNPGDEYVISGNIKYFGNIISSYGKLDVLSLPKICRLKVLFIADSGERFDITEIQKKYENDYFIHELHSDTTIENSVDRFNSIISSAYNILQENYSGHLAIEIELEVISNFITQFRLLRTENDSDKISLYVYLNWTSDREYEKERINPNGVKIDYTLGSTTYSIFYNLKEEYKEQQDGEFFLPRIKALKSPEVLYKVVNGVLTGSISEQEPIDDNTFRKNDGTDNPFICKIGEFNSTDKLTVKCTPYIIVNDIKYYLENLSNITSIDIEDLLTQQIKLNTWKYYIEDSSINLVYGFDSTLPDIPITKGYIDIYNVNRNDLLVQQENGDDVSIGDYSINPGYTKPITTQDLEIDQNKSSSLYVKHIDIDGQYLNLVGNIPYKIEFKDSLYKNNLYFAIITLESNGNPILRVKRFLYTSKQFNNDYNTCSDFDDLVLNNENLDITTEISQSSIGSLYGNKLDVSLDNYETFSNIDNIDYTNGNSPQFPYKIIKDGNINFLALYKSGEEIKEDNINILASRENIYNVALTSTIGADDENSLFTLDFKNTDNFINNSTIIGTDVLGDTSANIDQINISEINVEKGDSKNNTINFGITAAYKWRCKECEITYALESNKFIDYVYLPLLNFSLKSSASNCKFSDIDSNSIEDGISNFVGVSNRNDVIYLGPILDKQMQAEGYTQADLLQMYSYLAPLVKLKRNVEYTTADGWEQSVSAYDFLHPGMQNFKLSKVETSPWDQLINSIDGLFSENNSFKTSIFSTSRLYDDIDRSDTYKIKEPSADYIAVIYQGSDVNIKDDKGEIHSITKYPNGNTSTSIDTDGNPILTNGYIYNMGGRVVKRVNTPLLFLIMRNHNGDLLLIDPREIKSYAQFNDGSYNTSLFNTLYKVLKNPCNEQANVTGLSKITLPSGNSLRTNINVDVKNISFTLQVLGIQCSDKLPANLNCINPNINVNKTLSLDFSTDIDTDSYIQNAKANCYIVSKLQSLTALNERSYEFAYYLDRKYQQKLKDISKMLFTSSLNDNKINFANIVGGYSNFKAQNGAVTKIGSSTSSSDLINYEIAEDGSLRLELPVGKDSQYTFAYSTISEDTLDQTRIPLANDPTNIAKLSYLLYGGLVLQYPSRTTEEGTSQNLTETKEEISSTDEPKESLSTTDSIKGIRHLACLQVVQNISNYKATYGKQNNI